MAQDRRTIIANIRGITAERLLVAAEIIRGKMESHAKEIISDLVYDTPETWYHRTGNLRNQITTRVANDGGDIVIAVGTNVKYAPYVELGTGIYALGESHAKKIPWYYIGSDGEWHRSFGMHPRPFLRPAVEDYAEEYKRVLVQVLKDE